MIKIKCDAIKCLWNQDFSCTKEQIAIRIYHLYKFDSLIESIPSCASFAEKENKGHIDFSQFPKR